MRRKLELAAGHGEANHAGASDRKVDGGDERRGLGEAPGGGHGEVAVAAHLYARADQPQQLVFAVGQRVMQRLQAGRLHGVE